MNLASAIGVQAQILEVDQASYNATLPRLMAAESAIAAFEAESG